MLHTINKSPFSHDALRECLRVCVDNDAIVLIEDGVYATATDWAQQLTVCCKNIYALTPDIAARGLSAHVDSAIKTIDYTDFVQLCCEHTTIQSWY